MTEPRDAYRVLHVRPDADQAVIQAAYRVLARRYHADGTVPDPARMIEVNRAWECLRTADRRVRYDEGHRVAIAIVPEPSTAARRTPYDPWKHGTPPRTEASDVVDFGRYAGWRIADLARHDPDYVRWLSRHSTGIRYLDSIARCMPGDDTIGRRGSLVG